MIQELTSEQIFNEVVDYLKSRRCYLIRSGKNVYANCPFCQHYKPDVHHLYFGIWCYRKKVYLGCHNPLCTFGTSNNIIDFIQRLENVDFPTALAIWQNFLGIESTSEDRYLTCLNQLHEGCRDAYSGNGIYRQNHIIRISKRTLIGDFGWHHDELFAELFRHMVVLYFTKQYVNQKYLVQLLANNLQKLVRREIGRAEIEISEHRLSNKGGHPSNDILNYVSYEINFTDPLIEREKRENEQKALRMARERLDVIELRIITDDKFSIRKASQILGIPKSTIANRLKKKLREIKEECS